MKMLRICLLAFLAGVVLFVPGCTNNTNSYTLNINVSPESGPVNQVFTVQAVVSNIEDPMLSQLTYKWDWENDGTYDTAPSTNTTATHQYTTAGTYTIACLMEHSSGISSRTTKGVQVIITTDTSPTAVFSVTPLNGPVSTLFTVDASGCFDQEDTKEELQVRWDWENDGTWDTAFTTVKTASHQYSSAGGYTIRLEVKDTAGNTRTTQMSIIVTGGIPNTAPQAYLLVTPANGTPSTTFAFDAGGCTDTEDDTSLLQVRWDWDGNGTWDTAYSTTKTADHQFLASGDFTVKVQVKDTGGLTAIATKTVGVGAAVSNIAQAAYFPGGNVDVQLLIEPPASTTTYTVEDTPPAGWPIYGTISDGGSYNPATGKITWGPFADNQQRTLTYSLSVPLGSSGTKTFTGAAYFNGTIVDITGRRQISKYGG